MYMRLVLISLLAGLVLAGCAKPPVNRASATPLQAVAIDTPRYLGVWHEAARLPNGFEQDCVSATAEYGVREDGLISVRNVCTRADGQKRDAVGKARLAGGDGEGKLKVSFFEPFWADYWVLAHGDDYSWSIVGEPEGRYLWLLTRSAPISAEERAAFDARIRGLGYDTSKLYWDR